MVLDCVQTLYVKVHKPLYGVKIRKLHRMGNVYNEKHNISLEFQAIQKWPIIAALVNEVRVA